MNDLGQLGIDSSAAELKNMQWILEKQAKNADITQDVQYPTKLDCFNSMPVKKLSCGENHSLCEVELDKG